MPGMKADDQTRAEIVALVEETYRRLSTPGAGLAELMAHPDMALAGSGQGELFYDIDDIRGASDGVSSWGFRWTPDQVTVWREGDVAWAQILGTVHVMREAQDEVVPYWTTGVFVRNPAGWQWRYWGGSEPQESPRV